MLIGNWGVDIVFWVSDAEALQLQNISRTVGAEWASHSRIGAKDESEFLRPALQTVSFTLVLDATLGIHPRATLMLLEQLTERGAVNTLVIGGIRVGRHRWRINSINESWHTVLDRGELLRASANITMQEYI